MESSSASFGTGITRVAEFRLAYLRMGIVLILSINYFLSLASRPKSPHESSRRLGVTLASVSLIANFGQTIVDLVRGWDMFAVNFMNLGGFLTTTPLYFISPFLGLIPSTLTQLFLLRRITLFLSSLDLLWPRLAHPAIKSVFVVIMSCSVLLVFVSGTMSSVLIAKSGNMHALDVAGSSMFTVVEQIWLGGSTAVDLLLSLVLCVELWWARQKLGMKGGVMREIVTRLILVTCHGGLAVSGLQLSSLLLYNYWRHNSFCYLPIIFLPKVYNITLLLSLSVPHSTEVAHSPSHVFSLPTIMDAQPPALAQAQGNGSGPCVSSGCEQNPRRVQVPPNGCSNSIVQPAVQNDTAMREKNGNQWISRFKARLSPSGMSNADNRTQRETKVKQGAGPSSGIIEDRRPSDPSSLAPLLRHDAKGCCSPGGHFHPSAVSPTSPVLFPSPQSPLRIHGDTNSLDNHSPNRIVWVKPSTHPASETHTSLFQRPNPFTCTAEAAYSPSLAAASASAAPPGTNGFVRQAIQTSMADSPSASKAPGAGQSTSCPPIANTDQNRHRPVISPWRRRAKILGSRGDKVGYQDSDAGRPGLGPGAESTSQTRTMSSTFHTSQTGTGFNSLDIDGLTFDADDEEEEKLQARALIVDQEQNQDQDEDEELDCGKKQTSVHRDR
ncbi:hypothetical protein I316_03483 [Kwoniella heveanensis BCC8398]|uniref:DUF6534 domain-containing protein n=1 Tax=Kwoniella heveanensis BCC8398 TaxID=1296120 RepID=A0A1B9GV61_9TREE|nr:hypothetical protein I316_03483 [Kwoniella heveanensis BCC8398]